MATSLARVAEPDYAFELKQGKRPAEPAPAAAKPQLIAQQKTAEISPWARLLKHTCRSAEKLTALQSRILKETDTNAVRKFRVSSRRLELLLELVYGKRPPVHARKLRARARKGRRLLGELSDCNVLLAMAARGSAKRSKDAEAWKIIADFVQRRRQKIVGKVLKKLQRVDLAASCAKLQNDFEKVNTGGSIYHRGAYREMPAEKAKLIAQKRVTGAVGQLWQEFDSLVQESREDSCEQVIHGLRIATKRLRNAVLILKKLGLGKNGNVLSELRSLQKTIGEWHDIEVLEHATHELLAQKNFMREHLELAIHVEELLLHNRQRKHASEEQFRHTMAKSRGYHDMQHWVAKRVAA